MHHNCHDSGFANYRSVRSLVQYSSQQPRLELLNLPAGISQAGDFQHCGTTDHHAGSLGQADKIDPLGNNILAKITGRNSKATASQLGKKLSRYEMNLS